MNWITSLKTTLFSTIKTKALSVFCVMLLTALAISFVAGYKDREELNDLRGKVVIQLDVNKRLSDQNIDLLKEIKNKPVEYITVTKEVESQVCDGTVGLALINAIQSTKKEQANEAAESNTADIDAKLPTNLIKLLK